MTDASLSDQPNVTFDFNLPHGIGAGVETTVGPVQSDAMSDDTGSFDHAQGSAGLMPSLASSAATNTVSTEQQIDNEHELNYRQFLPGFSDDEGSGEAFERSWPSHRAKKQTATTAKGKKSPRRSDNDDEYFLSGARRKKPCQSLFGGPDEEMEIEEQVDKPLTPATPRHGLGSRMSSLTLDQQRDGDEYVELPVDTGFGLACSDIGSVRNSPAPSDDEFVVPPDAVPYYELRQNIDRKKAVTHVDTDKSGNFDPEQETKERAAKLVRTKAAKKEKKKKRKTRRKGEASRDYVMKCIVKLPFDAFGNVRNITNDEQNWPENWSGIDTEQERELKEYRAAFRVKTPDRRLQLPVEDPAGEVDDLTGHPAARGCKKCRELDQPCSMVKDGCYPCEECIEDGGECQPIQEPTVTGRCKQCDQTNEKVCSFENDPTQPICDHCADNDHICEALPPDGYKAPRVNIEEIIWGSDRPYVACTACRKGKKRCTLKGKEDKPPCKYCEKHNLGCTFFHLPKLDSEKQTAKKESLLETIAPEVARPKSDFFTEEDITDMARRNTRVLEREQTPEIEMEDGNGNKGMLTKITTSFAHPIRFSVEKATLSDCNFCEISIFGMVGYFEREVHVIRWHSGLGYAEVGGGHCQDTGETKMCSVCTNSRLQIVVCPDHDFERMTDVAVDHDAFAGELAEAEIGGADIQYQLQRWCSLCLSLASYGCSTVQPDVTGHEEAEITGCHLRLCVACEKSLREDYGGNFDQMVTDIDNKPKISEADEVLGKEVIGKPRADLGFLKQEGLLMSTVAAMED